MNKMEQQVVVKRKKMYFRSYNYHMLLDFPGTNLLFLQLLGNDDVIYEVNMRKVRASMEPFWDLKIERYYVE